VKEALPTPVRRQDYAPFPWRVATTELTFELDDTATRVTNRMALERSGETGELRLDADCEVERVAIDGIELSGNRFRREDDVLVLFDVPDRCTVEITTRVDPTANEALMGLYKSSSMLCTQCEAEGFRRITAFPDRPDVLSVYTTHLVAPAGRYGVLLANGNPVARETLPDGRERATWHDPFPKPSYLFALVAGNLERVSTRYTTASGRDVEIHLYTEPHNADQCAYALDALVRAMRWDEETYGREYDLDVFNVVAVDDFNMGAMENKGLNIFNTVCVLAHPEYTTDAGFLRVEGVVAHEYFHNWSGNRVTCRDWFQLSLKEGFTVFRDQEFSADMNSRTLKRIEDVELLRAVQFPEDAGPMAHPVRPDSYIEISNFYTPTVYDKGAEVVRMLHGLVGPETFRRGTDLYFERHDGRAVTIEDFVRCMEEASGRDLAQFRLWYAQAGTPELSVDGRWDAGVFELVVEQRCPPTPGQDTKAPMHVPVRLGLLDGSGHDVLGAPGVAVDGTAECDGPFEDGSVVVHVRAERETLRVTGLAEAPVPSVLRGFSAPVVVHQEQSPERLAFLARRDTDGFQRWDASQTLWARLLLDAVADGAPDLSGSGELLVPLGEDLLAQALATTDDDVIAMVAAMLTLPAESYLGDQMDVVAVDAIHRVRSGTLRWLGAALAQPLARVSERLAPAEAYAPRPGQMARRRLVNLARTLRVAADAEGAFEAELGRMATADNLTDRLAALRAVVHWGDRDAPGRAAAVQGALDGFRERYADQKLVLDQWFATQAADPRPGALDRVRALMTHSAFEPRNPNRMRSLVGAFANQNPVSFHQADGSGYRFLAAEVIRVNAFNPQLAAALMRPLTRWRRFDPARQAQLREALETVRDAPDLSPDVYEIVTKSLS
jgi:aminopeptidase N